MLAASTGRRCSRCVGDGGGGLQTRGGLVGSSERAELGGCTCSRTSAATANGLGRLTLGHDLAKTTIISIRNAKPSARMDDGERRHKRSHDKGDREHKKKRHRSDKEASSSRHKDKHHDRKTTRIVDDDVNDDDMWTEMNIDMEGEKVCASAVVFMYYADAWFSQLRQTFRCQRACS